MESRNVHSSQLSRPYFQPNRHHRSADALVIEKLVSRGRSDEAAKTFFSQSSELFGQVSLNVEELIAKLNEVLKDDLPDGVESLDPSEHTPEKTAQRIVDGSTAFFSVYQEQHPELSGDELVDSFMKTIRGGIETGFKDALSTLSQVGALEVPGVEGGIDETKKLVEEKLVEYEKSLRASLSKDSEASISHLTSKEAVLQGASALSVSREVVA
ncbi:MAG: DUF5610 domain-containing protein [Bdellovibrionales bacterium]|nr:DUF5610 domain-containing protein [Bdellovibrionales bacterium]